MPRSSRLSNKRGGPVPAYDVDSEGAKNYWKGLDIEAKLRILHFEDPAILTQVFSVQQDLVRSDLLCYQLGIRGQDSVRKRVGMDEFVMECSKDAFREDEVIPAAFYAKKEFAERSDLFEYIESRLRFVAKKRPVLQPSDWPLVLETRACSWADFMNQVLRLVELAMLHAHHESTTVGKIPSEVQEFDVAIQPIHGFNLDVVEEEEWLDDEVKTISKKSQKKARKKQRNIDYACLAGDLATPTSDDAGGGDDVAELAMSEGAAIRYGPPMSNLQAVDELSVVGQVDDIDSETEQGDGALDEAGSTLEEPNTAPGVIAESETFLKFDWSAEGQPIDSTEEPAVELRMDWSADGAQPKETFWSAWLPNGRTGSAAEWNWSTTDQDQYLRLRAFVKNTFIDAEDLSDTCSTCSSRGDFRIRARSLPAKRRQEF